MKKFCLVASLCLLLISGDVMAATERSVPPPPLIYPLSSGLTPDMDDFFREMLSGSRELTLQCGRIISTTLGFRNWATEAKLADSTDNLLRGYPAGVISSKSPNCWWWILTLVWAALTASVLWIKGRERGLEQMRDTQTAFGIVSLVLMTMSILLALYCVFTASFVIFVGSFLAILFSKPRDKDNIQA